MSFFPAYHFTKNRIVIYLLSDLVLLAALFLSEWLKGYLEKWLFIGLIAFIIIAHVYLIIDFIRSIPHSQAKMAHITTTTLLLIGLIILSFANVYLHIYEMYGTTMFSGEHLTSGDFLYYSITTFTNTGYGDITPLHYLTNGIAAVEMIIGYFSGTVFMAILVWKLTQSSQKQAN